MAEAQEEFGCAVCWPSSAEEAYDGSQEVNLVAELVDESHFIARIVACRICGQRYLNVFTELIDWEGGEDPCSRRRLPLTEQEVDSLRADPTEQRFNALADDRKCLAFDWPKGMPKAVYWTCGMYVGPHD